MNDLPSQKDIERISMDILKQSKTIDVFPTPVDRIVEFADLVFEGSIDLSHVDDSFLKSVGAKFLGFWKNVRGFLDRKERTIYLDLSQKPKRQNFVKLHETAHKILTWQGEILQFLDNDETLSFETNEEFEREANYFASLTIFQHDRFDSELNSLDLSLKSGMHLSNKFGGSIHAALRRMVERSNKRCALLVLKRDENNPTNRHGLKKDFFQSKNFIKHFGELELPEEFGYEWSFGRDFIFSKKFDENGEIELETKNGEVEFHYHYFHNSFNGFVFLFPKGEKNRTKVNYIIKGIAK